MNKKTFIEYDHNFFAQIDVTFTYTEQPQNDSSAFQVQKAEFKFTIEWGYEANLNRG